jgi:hypothetical protein
MKYNDLWITFGVYQIFSNFVSNKFNPIIE